MKATLLSGERLLGEKPEMHVAQGTKACDDTRKAAKNDALSNGALAPASMICVAIVEVELTRHAWLRVDEKQRRPSSRTLVASDHSRHHWPRTPLDARPYASRRYGVRDRGLVRLFRERHERRPNDSVVTCGPGE